MKNTTSLILVCIIGLGFFLRIYNLAAFAPFTDEKFTLLNANGVCVGGANQQDVFKKKYFSSDEFWKPKKTFDYFEAVARSDFGTHIVYNGVLNLWMKAVGMSDFNVRILSGIINILTILLLFLLVNKYLKSPLIALLSVFLLAIEPLNIAQSHVARSYTLSFLLILLGTYIFLKLVENNITTKRKIILTALYALVASLALLNHYLNFLVFLSHLLLCLRYERKIMNWVFLSAAGIITLSVMFWWFTAGGGQWSMQFLKDKNELHTKLANLPPDQNPLRGVVDKSTFKNVSAKVIDIFFDLNPISNNLFQFVLGFKNFIATLLIAFCLFFLEKNYRKPIWSIPLLILIGLGIFFFVGNKIYILPVVFTYYLVFLFVEWLIKSFKSLDKNAQKFIVIAILMSLLPMGYMIFDAAKSGHTTSLSQRYVGASIPFVALIYAIALREFLRKNIYIKLIGGLFVLFQVYQLIMVIDGILHDQSAKYTQFTSPRIVNPYFKSAQWIKENYAKGDTLILPSQNTNVYSKFLAEKPEMSVLDAQYLNVYFTKNAGIIQRIDPYEADKLILKKADGSQRLVFDFEGTKYRY
jgi:4-amino-4-deoxy-L-arabinose transferase-like glycosyltransferase